jgi:BirA family biotin operon repressor/biotin-[acetyl-CoA-carboxylase] ligase
MNDTRITEWSDRLRAVMGGRGRIVVLSEATSTQDAARRLGARAGDAVVALRQVAGRGRLGRRWHDPEGEGVAVTIVAELAPPEHMAAAGAVGCAEAVERFLGRMVGIKWPNDVMVEGRKIAGLLVETGERLARIGIGVNVTQRAWPANLADRAVSLAQLGVVTDRLEVLEALLRAVPQAWDRPTRSLSEAYARRDVLRGASASFRCRGEVVTGRVLAVDPARGLLVETARGTRQLEAATTTLLPDTAADHSCRG